MATPRTGRNWHLPTSANWNPVERPGEPEVVTDRGAAVTWDGGGCPASGWPLPWIGERAPRTAWQPWSLLASHHIAGLAVFLERAPIAAITIASSDPAVASVAPFGGRTAVLTPDLLAVGVPTEGEPILIDISVFDHHQWDGDRCAARASRFPGPWALDAVGRLTDDPGVCSPIRREPCCRSAGWTTGTRDTDSLLVEALTQGLAGYGRAEKDAAGGASVFVQVIDPAAFGGLDGFRREMDGWQVHAAPPPNARVDAVRLPGERGWSARSEHWPRALLSTPVSWRHSHATQGTSK